ncbi:sushi, nidogen and EGF-like domain-containing protein 1 isoform X2 [Megalobrama amblycephala]|uniref:sushi, nidogen and EGF-like domain-containing protein 1 isoform X2 n=1 Tax=Megalobrama amblycephala TaxID=75352 RepID=UPI002013FE80|nr:sushi, nidogen and EGF-like domain-containing protein 1 isoform X2 [Megalobrama amblycephala]
MRLSPVSQVLLVLLSVVALTRAQTATQTSADTTTAEPATTQTSADTTTAEPATTQAIATPTTTAWTAPAIFYPFGLAAGDGEQLETGYETFVNFTFSTPFTYFGRKYNYIYVNNNGLLTFNQPVQEADPIIIPIHGAEDFIAPFWTDLDDIGLGKYWYQQYTSGSVLTRATQDINQYFPHIGFTASSVFVATWDYANTGDINVFNLRSAPTITFQAVLISGGGFSFILMNYGDCVSYFPLEVGYDTINSTDYHVIHYENAGFSILNLKNTTNVDVPGRWAFLVNNGTENVLGVQIKLSSFLDMTQTGNIEDVLKQIKQELVNRGASSFFEMKLRNVKKTQP